MELNSVVNVEPVSFGLLQNLEDIDVRTRIYRLKFLNSDETQKQIKSKR